MRVNAGTMPRVEPRVYVERNHTHEGHLERILDRSG